MLTLALAANGCCPKVARLATPGVDGVRIDRDTQVEEWRLNGEEICSASIEAAPGCTVLEVKYSVAFQHTQAGGVFQNPIFAGGLLAAAERESKTHRAAYQSVRMPFAVLLRSQHTYYVTATFTGDEFLPRIVERTVDGEWVRELKIMRNPQELADCKAGRISTSAVTPGAAATSLKNESAGPDAKAPSTGPPTAPEGPTEAESPLGF